MLWLLGLLIALLALVALGVAGWSLWGRARVLTRAVGKASDAASRAVSPQAPPTTP